MALSERRTQSAASTAHTVRPAVVRVVALCLLGALTFLLWLHIHEHGWDAAGVGVFLLLEPPALWAALRPCWLAEVLGRWRA